MKTILLATAAACALFAARAGASTALDALKLIPETDRANLAIIDGHDGNPTPERWHFLSFDPAAENGLREFVVEDGRVVAQREVSQFARALKPADVVGAAGLNIDSDMVARTAQRFARVNGREIASMNFALRKDESEGVPVWSVVCIDADGHAFASLIVTGDEGRIVSHEGFAVDPAAVAEQTTRDQDRQVREANARRKARVADADRFDDWPGSFFDNADDDDRPSSARRGGFHRDRAHVVNPVDDVIKPLHRIIRGLLPF
ncbi:MAG TPA: hypothetical protein VEO95_11675 [Chthoniobacteraceae bacterium]|nr:hypothetical protein [Chthoniobacteraceae bacterium]